MQKALPQASIWKLPKAILDSNHQSKTKKKKKKENQKKKKKKKKREFPLWCNRIGSVAAAPGSRFNPQPGAVG